MPYQRVEPSRPRWTPPGVHYLTFHSEALGMRGTVTLYIHSECEKMTAVPLVLLLHGVFGDHWSWCGMGGAHERTRGLIESGRIPPMVIAMPSDGLVGEGSGYVPHPGRDCERWIVDDVVGCCREVHPCLGAASPLFIAGFSMGGLGALRLGAKYADRFRGISGHASATHYDQMARFWSLPRGNESHLGEADKSALFWIERHRHKLPPLRFDCGNEDIPVEHNRELHAQLEARSIPHLYSEVPGRHSWDYCHDHLGDSLEFFGSLMK